MYEGLPTLDDVDVTGKRVLLRVAYDVPLAAEARSSKREVGDDTRIRVTIPTIQRFIADGCQIVICGGWLGRPDGIDPTLRMDPVAARLSELLDRPVQKLDDCVGPAVEQAAARLQPGEILLLENTRFHAEEKANDLAFVQQLASLAEVCVFDAFAQAHRDHASTTGLVRSMPTVLGPLMVEELTALARVTTNPARPFVVVIGGAKITDKIGMLRRLVADADHLLVGGALANVFLKSRGVDVGTSVVESADIESSGLDPLESAREITTLAGAKLVLPSDCIAGDDKKEPSVTETVTLGTDQLPPGHGFFDCGPATSTRFASLISSAKTVFWNGTMGVNTTPAFAAGTKVIAEAIAKTKQAVTVVGGGDTAESVHQFDLDGQFTHVSTGGGASLKVVSGQELAVIAVMKAAQQEAGRPAGRGF